MILFIGFLLALLVILVGLLFLFEHSHRGEIAALEQGHEGVIHSMKQEHTSEVSNLVRRNTNLHARVVATEEYANRVVLGVVPLLEKTDWMSGRWNGQFQSLVSMEAKRNGKIDKVRRDLNSIPVVHETSIAMVRNGEFVIRGL